MTPQNKSEWRQWAKAQRQTLDIPTLSDRIGQQLSQWDVFLSAQTVLAYYPLPHEIDTRAWMQAHPDKHWFIPKTEGDDLHFYRYHPDRLLPGPFGLMEPDPARCDALPKRATPELILVPCLAADKNGYRLGYGKGYYDRLFQKGGSLGKIGIVPESLRVDNLPADSWDQPLDALLTENGIHLVH